jgi:hypothetical protein
VPIPAEHHDAVVAHLASEHDVLARPARGAAGGDHQDGAVELRRFGDRSSRSRRTRHVDVRAVAPPSPIDVGDVDGDAARASGAVDLTNATNSVTPELRLANTR